MLPANYLERVYAGFLGMNIGIRLGAPVEPEVWTFERIERVYGDIRDYVKPYRTFSADDDANGPIFFIRALYDDAVDRELTAQDVARAWLNYAREGVGMFWWGGVGVSTEHTAYVNLRKGIEAPASGSIAVNGEILAEQIGGQIFVDVWGLLWPGNMEKAALYAERAASVSHDRNGLYGARFIAACIAKAFEADSVDEVVEAALGMIPADSLYAQVVRAVMDFHDRHPHDWRACRRFLETEWGYDKYGGVCHIIPNAGVCVLALLYGGGDFARTVEIATMCGWDTDCNAGNVGTIAGVLCGLAGIPGHYRKPINDCIVASSVSGYLNIVDLPTFCKELALLSCRLHGLEPPRKLANGVRFGELYFDFDLPGSTHGIRTSNPFKTPVIRHSRRVRYGESGGSLEIVFDRITNVESSKICYKPYYRREDFNDEKYKPTFAPQVYSGQTVEFKLWLDQWEGAPLRITPYVRDTYTKEDVLLEAVELVRGEWNTLSFVVPPLAGSFADEVGFMIDSPTSTAASRAFGALYIGRMRVYGGGGYAIDWRKQAVEFTSVTPMAQHRGEWSLKDGALHYAVEGNAAAFTGNYYARDVEAEAEFTPLSGESHGFVARALGIERCYWLGLAEEGTVSIRKNDFGWTELASASFPWEHGRTYALKMIVRGASLKLYVDDKLVVEAEDAQYAHGMYGVASLRDAAGSVGEFRVISFTVQDGMER
ncbi:ADP-ribosylation/Crystallin J1 [Thermobacillus xylanilyticus]|uniref:ADP-ribosylation/Crystallin J1 n=1 Tax=Thermobacillus xylanilyticus TaxID=76633 RepID=A0ABM8V3X7_THEXY|nr:ADP-ribosylglycohydrolase family protein [Thermobacillus xylanilyticus]CAG5085898.1 ADP-ribosylation/Crystallin J1 [Thermobacillus xylanilyticus]